MSLDVQADEVEFLSPRQQSDGKPDEQSGAGVDMAGFTDVSADDIPF